jgi:hypothetical protein
LLQRDRFNASPSAPLTDSGSIRLAVPVANRSSSWTCTAMTATAAPSMRSLLSRSLGCLSLPASEDRVGRHRPQFRRSDVLDRPDDPRRGGRRRPPRGSHSHPDLRRLPGPSRRQRRRGTRRRRVVMPRMNGRELAPALRRCRPDLPIPARISMTAVFGAMAGKLGTTLASCRTPRA